ncbi:MAG: monovalent cation/H+ antiporter complex subunit F [Rubricoccaceae bacterium]
MPEASAVLGGAATFAFAALSAALVLSLVRLVRGPSLPDRVVALDLIGYLVVGFVVLYAIVTDEPAFLDAAVILALIAFVGTVAFARYVEFTNDLSQLPPRLLWLHRKQHGDTPDPSLPKPPSEPV